MLLSTACLLPPLVRSLSHSISLPLSSARMLSLPIHPLLHSVHPLLLSALMISLSTYTLFRSTYQFYRQWIQGAEKNRLPCASSNNCKSHRAAVNKTGLQQNWRERAGIFLTSLLLYSEDITIGPQLLYNHRFSGVMVESFNARCDASAPVWEALQTKIYSFSQIAE